MAIQEQDLYALSDVTELFEQYFARFLSDNSDIDKKENLKALGLISFFYTIPYKDKVICENILAKFDFDYDDFVESIDILNRLELVEIRFDYIKISEQNLATYFFFKTFIKDELLSFRTLLENYYDSNLERFKDTIIAANNTFGYKNVIQKVKPILTGYWNKIKTEENKAFNLLSTFWFYLEDETIELIYNLINRIEEPVRPEYSTSYENNQFSFNRNRILSMLGNFYNYPNKLKETLELAYEYSRKQPQTLPELVYTIREHLLFDNGDYRFNYERQEILINLIIDKCNMSEGIYEITFPSIAATFLQYKYHHTKGGRNHSFYFYNYPFPLNDITKKIREKIWEKIDRDFNKNADSYFQILNEYSKRTPDVELDVMIFDVEYILTIINNHLTSSNFEHCYYVQEQIRWLNKNGIQNVELDLLRSEFVNSVYGTYLKIYWDRLRDKESYEFENFDEYERLKETEIRESFVFNSIKEFKDFYGQYEYLLKWEDNRYWMTQSFDIVIDANFEKNFDLGLEIIKCIIKSNNSIQYTPSLPFRKLLVDQYRAEKIWDVISRNKYEHSTNWQIIFFYHLDEKIINRNDCKNLLSTINNINISTSIYFPNLNKYLKFDDKLFSAILKIIVQKQKNDKIFISIAHNFFSEHINYLKEDLDIVKEEYLLQDDYDRHFDYEGKEFLAILKFDKSFLFDFIVHLYEKEDRHRSYEHRILSIVWLIDDIQDTLIKVFDYIAEKEIYLGILEHFCNSFFYEIKSEENKAKSNHFIITYIDKNYNNVAKMNMMVDVLRHTKKDFFETAYFHFLELNQDVNMYSKIWWVENGGTTVGNESLGERLALKWRKILEITKNIDLGIKLIPIKKYINDRIEHELEHAEYEKRSRFLDRF